MKAEQIRKVHCLFEQSGTFKNEFIKLGIPAEDYDIQNNFNQTDHVIDLFAEIEKAYERRTQNAEVCSIFDTMSSSDIVFAFFPCIYFTGSVNPCYFTLENTNYKNLSTVEKFEKILEREENRHNFYRLLYKLCAVCIISKIKLVIENPYSSLHYLHNNFLKEPSVIDSNRQLRGDYFKKPTGFWFFNFEPTYGESFQKPKKTMTVWSAARGKEAGICSEERSLISPDYARNFICDFILGKQQKCIAQQQFEFD